jgi:hypothetical protein
LSVSEHYWATVLLAFLAGAFAFRDFFAGVLAAYVQVFTGFFILALPEKR